MLFMSWYVQSSAGTAKQLVTGTVDRSNNKTAASAVASTLSEESECILNIFVELSYNSLCMVKFQAGAGPA